MVVSIRKKSEPIWGHILQSVIEESALNKVMRYSYSYHCTQLYEAIILRILKFLRIFKKRHFPSKSVKITSVIYCFPACNCNEEGSRDVTCDDDTGKCTCKANVIGDKCDFCSPGNFGFPACQGTIPFKINHSVHNILMY